MIAERRGRIPSGYSESLMIEVLNTLPIIHPTLPDLLPRAHKIATQIGATVYDSLYVALAERQKCELITADDKLVRRAQPSFSFVRTLATMP